ncbi:hypothetical protein ACOSP7_025123 [Xanthoceras sorbifolium]
MEAQSHHHTQLESPPPPPSLPSLSSISYTQIEENDRTHHPHHHLHQEELEPRSGMVPYRPNVWLFGAASAPTTGDNDAWSFFTLAASFWFLASLFVIFGFYGSLDIQLNPNYSILIQTNTFFVQSIKAKQVYHQNSGILMLYGFHEPPPLDVEIAWTETHNAAVMFDEHKEWLYYLNKGSKVDISYNVKSPSSAPLSLVIAQGRNGLTDWVDDPSDANATLSWNIMFGSGEIHQGISESDFYYIAVGNLNSQKVEVQLNFTVNALVYNTTNAYYNCSLSSRKCSLTLYYLRADAAVITTPCPTEGTFNDNWYVKISYGPRWMTFFVGSGMMTVLMLLAFRFCKTSQTTITDVIRIQAADVGSARNPLLLHKDDDLSSEAIFSDSPSPDEEDSEGSSNKGICVICYNAPRDCFFLPCGHATSCYACATRIKEGGGLCPMCRKGTKKVQRIFSV